MTQSIEDVRRQLAEALLTAKLSSELDSDYAQVVAANRAGSVEFTHDGEVDKDSLKAITAAVVKSAPQKFRRSTTEPAGDRSSAGTNFYDDLRAAVAKRYEVPQVRGTDALTERAGSPRKAV